jgi:hypothetical protein
LLIQHSYMQAIILICALDLYFRRKWLLLAWQPKFTAWGFWFFTLLALVWIQWLTSSSASPAWSGCMSLWVHT